MVLRPAPPARATSRTAPVPRSTAASSSRGEPGAEVAVDEHRRLHPTPALPLHGSPLNGPEPRNTVLVQLIVHQLKTASSERAQLHLRGGGARPRGGVSRRGLTQASERTEQHRREHPRHQHHARHRPRSRVPAVYGRSVVGRLQAFRRGLHPQHHDHAQVVAERHDREEDAQDRDGDQVGAGRGWRRRTTCRGSRRWRGCRRGRA